MPSLIDDRKEQFAQLRAKGWRMAPAYRACYDTDAIPSAIWNMASLLNREVSVRIAELTEAVALNTESDPTLLSRVELARDLAEAWRTPLDAIDESSQFAQEVKTTTDPEGNVHKTVKAVSKAAMSAQYQALVGWSIQGPQSVTINNLTVNNPAQLEDKARALAAQFALPTAKIIEMETAL